MALLAGRKLLLADDSITIQKVVALTFADEGVEVVTVSNGNEAIEKLEEVTPDIVLADVFMPPANGYEVCEYIKQNAKLKHIPVMLLVGSFEPFDEAEARRVGADDTLTKPFKSIRRLIDKVGGLVTGKRASDEEPTAELPHVAEEAAEPEKLSTEELEITTADTQPLPTEESPDEPAHKVAAAISREYVADTFREDQKVDRRMNEPVTEASVDSGEVLLDLGDIDEVVDTNEDDFVLDIDLEVDEAEVVQAMSAGKPHAFVEPQISQPAVVGWDVQSAAPKIAPASVDRSGLGAGETRAEVSKPAYGRSKEKSERLERVLDEPSKVERDVPTGKIGAGELSPEAIDAIARRAVEYLSERVVQDIAWEVVPQLAELLIKRKLEEKESQPK
ncbi:MAG: response regulator [Pyrinomonadaceae bacterium]